jgi:hypothetical protein
VDRGNLHAFIPREDGRVHPGDVTGAKKADFEFGHKEYRFIEPLIH